MRVLHRTRAHGTLFPALPRSPGGPLRSPLGSRVVPVARSPGRPQARLSAGQDSGGDYGDQIREPGSPGSGDTDPGHIQGAEESWETPCNATRNKTQLAESPKPTQQGGLRPSSLTLPLFGARRSVGETGSGATLGGGRARKAAGPQSHGPRRRRGCSAETGLRPRQPPSPSRLRRQEPLYNSSGSAGGERAPIAGGLPLTQALRRLSTAPAGRGVPARAGGPSWLRTPRTGDTPRQLGKLGRGCDEIKSPRVKSPQLPSPGSALSIRVQVGV